MTPVAIIASFVIESDEYLKPLMEQGFGKPVKTERGMQTIKETCKYTSTMDVERIENQVFVSIAVDTAQGSVMALKELHTILRKAGLLEAAT